MTPTDIAWAFFVGVLVTVAALAIETISTLGAPVAYMGFH